MLIAVIFRGSLWIMIKEEDVHGKKIPRAIIPQGRGSCQEAFTRRIQCTPEPLDVAYNTPQEYFEKRRVYFPPPVRQYYLFLSYF